jgi:hypothetical protein
VLTLPILLYSLLSPAQAAGFQAKTMRAPLSASEVERALVIGRGWLEFAVGADIKYATGFWDSEGNAQEFDYARWLYTTERLGIRYGIARRGEFFWDIPFHYARLTNEQLGTDISDFGIGDIHFGYRYEMLRRNAPLTSLIAELEMKVPSGAEAPASYIGGPNTMTTIVFSTGQPDLYLALHGKQQFGPLAITAGASYIHRFSAVTQFLVEVKEYQFQGRFKPGDEIRLHLEPMLQLGPVAASANTVFGIRRMAYMGTTSSGLIPDANLDPVEGTDGMTLDISPALTFNITRGFDARFGATLPLMGEDLAFWPLEEISPTRGITGSATLEFRY